ncbi:hypothetical protein D3C80_2127950 [compost metagenome]
MLVGAAGVEDDDALVGTLLGHGNGRGDRVARENRLLETQFLAEIDGAGAGQLCAEHG